MVDKQQRASEVGLVVKTKRYLLTLEGLPSARVNDILIDTKAIWRLQLVTITSRHSGGVSGYRRPVSVLSIRTHVLVRRTFVRTCDQHLGVPIDGKGSFR